MKQISAKTVKIRKPHHCWGCTKEFPVGTELLAVTSEDGGKLSTVYWCDVCDGWLLSHRNEWSENDGFDYGDLLEYDSYPKPISPNKGEDWKEIKPLDIKPCIHMKIINGMKTCPAKCDKCGELARDISQEEKA